MTASAHGDVVKADIVRLVEAAVKEHRANSRYDPALSVLNVEHGTLTVEARWEHGLVLHYRIRVSGMNKY